MEQYIYENDNIFEYISLKVIDKLINVYGYKKEDVILNYSLNGRIIIDILITLNKQPHIIVEIKKDNTINNLNKLLNIVPNDLNNFIDHPLYYLLVIDEEFYVYEFKDRNLIQRPLSILNKRDEFLKNFSYYLRREDVIYLNDRVDIFELLYTDKSKIFKNEYVDELLKVSDNNNLKEISNKNDNLFKFIKYNNSGAENKSFVNGGNNEPIQFSISSGKDIDPSKSFILDVWAYKINQLETVKKLMKSFKREELKAKKTVKSIPVDTLLDIYINIDEIGFKSQGVIYWLGNPEYETFKIKIPGNHKNKSIIGTVDIMCDGILIVNMDFQISFRNLEVNNFEVNYLKTAFASYSSEDTGEVLKRIQGIKKILPDLDIFMDRITLNSGDDWESELKKHIPTKDKFYLFWSISALNSKWVKKEWKMALKERGIRYIDPIILSDIRDAPVPKELNTLHFNDKYLAYIQYEENRKSNKN